MILVTQAVFMMLLSPIAGRLSDKYDPGKIASIGMGIMSIGLMILALINEDTSLYILILGLGVLGLGVGLFSAPNTNAIMSSVEKKFYGAASATLSTMRLLGQTFGMGLVLIILAIFLGAVQINPSNYGNLLNSIRLSFFIAVLLSIIAIFASLARNKRGTKYGQ